MPRKKKSDILTDELHLLVEELDPRDLYTAKRFLAYVRNTRDPLLQKLVEIAYDDEPLTGEDEAAIAEAWKDLKAGLVGTMEEFERELGLRTGESS